MAKKVFIFDDNPDILELCTIILTDAGYDTKTSFHSNNIVNQVEEYMPDLIFMDNWLPDLGGLEATKTLKNTERLKHIPVIYFSANNDVKNLAAQAGADNYLSKPFDIDVFEKLVKEYL
ncbi:MAG: response regulator [Pedobacter sp.]|nr:MAG: response regulator [Pedobacter sp.]